MDDGTYAPQSPDLSSFLSSPSKSQQPYQSTTSYAPRSPVIPSYNTHLPHQAEAEAQAQAHTQLYHPHPHQAQAQAQAQAQGQHYYPHPQHQQSFAIGNSAQFPSYGQNSYMPPIPALPPAHSSFGTPQQNPSFYPIKSEDPYEYKQSFDGADDHYIPSAMSRMPRNPASPSSSSLFAPAPQTQAKNPNPNNIEIKTKFPVARIKRIMQADEEVGKVAQVTPVAVSKALELFMISLVSGAAEKAREKGGKRVTAQHLKTVVQADEQFDFLSEIVGKVADGVEAGGEGKKRKGKSESSDSEEEKKGRKGKGRRRKADD